MRRKRKRLSNRPTVAELDALWAKCIKARAGWKSEYSGKEDCLHSHHIGGKSCHAMRWSLWNGICLTSGEHFFIAHNQGRSQKMRCLAMKIRGVSEEDFDYISNRQSFGKDKFAVKEYLKRKLYLYENRNNDQRV